MNLTSQIVIARILLPVIFLGFGAAFTPKSMVTQGQAIRLAEQFIIDNGYTALPANRSKLSYELMDHDDVDAILKRRYNTLQPKAFCIGEDDDRWDVGFLSSDVDLSKLDSLQRQTDLPGRAVIVMKDGTGVRMAHKEPLFSFFKKL